MGRFVLPKTQQAANWVRSTDALRNHLKQRLASVKDRADVKRKEAEAIEAEGVQLEQAIVLLDQLLPPKDAKSASAAPGPSPAGVTPITQASGRWSNMFDVCTRCGTNTKKHMARGLCSTCYFHDTHQRAETDEVVVEPVPVQP